MQQPKGIAVALGVILGLVVVGAIVGAIVLFHSSPATPAATNTNGALQLGCTVDADCSSYCGVDPCYQPICGVTTTGAAGSCTCRSTCGPNPQVSNTNATVNTNSSANTNASVSTAGWKTFTNTIVGYTLRYPADWIASEQYNEKTQSLIYPKSETGGSGVSPTQGVIIKQVSNQAEASQLTEKKTITINGIIGVQGKKEGIPHEWVTLLTKGSLTIRISWVYVGAADEDTTILSTLTFLDETAGWKTYSNTAWSFSFRYPGDWAVTKNNLQSIGKEALPENAILVGKGQRPSLSLYVDPMGWDAGNAYYVITTKKQNGKIIIVNEEATIAQPGEFGLGEYYSVTVLETDSAANPKLLITFVSDIKGSTSTEFNSFVKTILSTFTFTK